MTEKKADVWAELRKPFPKDVMGLLPKVSCYGCSEATKAARSALDKHCNKHAMKKCAGCGAYITEGHIHLDYVGHAATTDRLNNVVGPDGWSWEPLAYGQDGLPQLDRNGNLWIKLTVKGVVRLGYGDGSNSMKELIGDALRNAAMRFGIALDLWSKDELESTLEDPSLKSEKLTAPRGKPAAEGFTHGTFATQIQKQQIKAYLIGQGVKDDNMATVLATVYGVFDPKNMSESEADRVIKEMQAKQVVAA